MGRADTRIKMRLFWIAIGLCLIVVSRSTADDGARPPDAVGVRMPDRLRVGETDLVLNGVGVRTRYRLSFYEGALYVRRRGTDGARFIEADEPMTIRLRIVSDLITGKIMTEATMEGFRNSTGGHIEPFRDRIDMFLTVFREDIRKNDIFDIVYDGGGRVEVFRNGEKKAAADGLDFKQALFGIWLGERATDRGMERLREAMLNRQ